MSSGGCGEVKDPFQIMHLHGEIIRREGWLGIHYRKSQYRITEGLLNRGTKTQLVRFDRPSTAPMEIPPCPGYFYARNNDLQDTVKIQQWRS